MNWTLARFGTAVIVGWSLCTACTLGQVGISFNGSTASPAVLSPGDVLDLHVSGPPGAPFAALISPSPRFEVTPYGILLANPLDAEATIFLDGLDPLSPTYGFASIPYGGWPFSQTYVPFGPGGGYAPSYWIQALVVDSLNPAGFTLTNAIELRYASPPPGITSIEPNFASPGVLVHVIGTDFFADPALDVVRVNGLPCQVIAATPTDLTVMVPDGARSGPISVQTPQGQSPANPDEMFRWLAIAPASFAIDTAVLPGPVNAPLSILGTLALHDFRDYVIHLQAGQELVAELYVFDPTKFRITNQTNAVTAWFNPFLVIRRNPSQPVTVLTDDDSGPGVTAAIGLTSGSPHYVASFAEDIIVEATSQGGLSSGPYLLLLSTRPATGLPVTVGGLFPSDARVGDVVTIMGSGFDPTQPGLHTVILPGANVTPDAVTLGTLVFTVPPGARSGPVVVSAPSGNSNYDPDRMESWLCIHAYTEIFEVEGTEPTVPVGCTIHGTIYTGYDTDDYLVDLAAGQTLRIECHAINPLSGTIITSTLFVPTPLDPQIQIYPAVGTQVILAADQNSGPGLSAGLGLVPGNPPFTAPYAGTFRIRVGSFFAFSHGDYMLVINPGP